MGTCTKIYSKLNETLLLSVRFCQRNLLFIKTYYWMLPAFGWKRTIKKTSVSGDRYYTKLNKQMAVDVFYAVPTLAYLQLWQYHGQSI